MQKNTQDQENKTINYNTGTDQNKKESSKWNG